MSAVADAVRAGLSAAKKKLPPFLFYDDRGSELFEEITLLPEYYLTRTERSILERDGAAIARALVASSPGSLSVVELGAGTATKTEVLLRALVDQGRSIEYFPADVSPAPLDEGAARLRANLPKLRVHPVVGPHARALETVRACEGAPVVLFLGSSIGNYDDRDAIELMSLVRAAIGGRDGTIVLGFDRKKSLDVLLPAYADPAGVTAAFNLNVLARINRELDADFDLDAFRHVALWNEAAGAVEMHLESTRAQRVHVSALDLAVTFDRSERIHTESSHKYTKERIESLLRASGFAPPSTFEDDRRWFSLCLARAARTGREPSR